MSSLKRGRSPERDSLWLPASQNTIQRAVNLPTLITGPLTPEQLDAYQVVYRIDEITQKISRNDVIPSSRERSPSPPPQYDAQGRRTNTREQRHKKRLEDERHRLVDIAARIVPHYVAPSDYRRPKNLIQKFFIPVKEHPEINFIGQLLGPRGNTLRKLQQDSGARIQIRGKGSVKEGKGRNAATPQMNQDEPLHCIITADDEDKIELAIKGCQEVVDRAVFSPEGQNDLKRGQLRELAELNGTLRDDTDRPCPVCGIRGHKRWECPEKDNYLSKIVCRICGLPGHYARDCKQNTNNINPNNNDFNNRATSQELDNMLNNLNATYNNNNNINNNNNNQEPYPAYKRRNIATEAPVIPSNSSTLPPPPRAPGFGIIPPPSLAPPPGLAPPGLAPPPGISNSPAPPGLNTINPPPPSLSAPAPPPGLNQPAPPPPPGLNAANPPPPGIPTQPSNQPPPPPSS